MVANNYLDEGRPHREVIEMMALGFTGKLQQWWNNCLTEVSYPDCPKEFLTRNKPIREPLLYCGLCNNYVRDHGHKCTDDGPWGPYPSDDPDTD